MIIAFIAAWFTPTVLFCVTSLIIAIIFVASNNNNKNNNKHRDHAHGDSVTGFTRVSSFVDRAKSLTLSSYTTTTQHYQYPSQSKTVNFSSSSRLAQSILTPPTQPVHIPSLLERVKSFKFSTESEQITDSPGHFGRVPSFFDRVKSFRISGAPFTQPVNVNTDPGHNPDHQVIKSKSEKTSVKKQLSVDMKKSRSEMKIAQDEDEDFDLRPPATTRERRTVVDEEVDAKADDFISRFKQQLKLQRLESLVRYNQLLKRRS